MAASFIQARLYKIYDGTSGYFNLMTPSTYVRLINSFVFYIRIQIRFLSCFSYRKLIRSRRVQQPSERNCDYLITSYKTYKKKSNSCEFVRIFIIEISLD